MTKGLLAAFLLLAGLVQAGEVIPDYAAQRGLHFAAPWIVTDLAYKLINTPGQGERLSESLFVGLAFVAGVQLYEDSIGEGFNVTNTTWNAAGLAGSLLCNYKWGEKVRVASMHDGAMVSISWSR